MAASLRGQQQHIGISGDRWIKEWLEGKEGVVPGMNDQGWDANASDERPRTRLRIIVIRVRKSKMRRDVAVVELLDAAYAAQQTGIVGVGEEFFFDLDAVLQTPEKALLINPVAPPGNQIGR